MATEQIPTTLIADDAVTTAKVADDAVTTAKVADDAITGALIENNPTIAGTLNVTGAFTAAGGIANAGTITAGTIGGGVAMASSGVTVRNITQVSLGSDQSLSNDATATTFFAPTYTPLFFLYLLALNRKKRHKLHCKMLHLILVRRKKP